MSIQSNNLNRTNNKLKLHGIPINGGKQEDKLYFQVDKMDQNGIGQLMRSSYTRTVQEVQNENKIDRLQKIDQSMVYEPELHKLTIKPLKFHPYHIIRCSSQQAYTQKVEFDLGYSGHIKLQKQPLVEKKGIKARGSPHIYYKKLKYHDDY